MSIIAGVWAGDGSVSLRRLLAMSAGLDVWEVASDHLVVQVSEAQAERIEQMGYAVEQLETTERHLSTFGADRAARGYHTAETLERDMRELAEAQPEIAEVQEIGRSVENRPVVALRIGERRGSTRKMLFLGCHHAREWIAVEVPYLLAEHLLKSASSEPVQSWLQKGELWVVPMVNPDGHEHSRTTSRLWRKNRARNPDGSFGVDPNRNYGYMWGALDVDTSSHVPRDETYVGPRAFSEPEVRAVRNLVGRELFAGVISYHSYSQLILYPWGYTEDVIGDTPSRQFMEDAAVDMQEQIHAVRGEKYTVMQSSGLYPTAGDTTDWTYGEFHAPSLTVELRPRTHAEGGFILPPEEIQPTWEENRPAATAFIGRVFDA